MKSITLNFRDARVEPAPCTDESVVTAFRYEYPNENIEFGVETEDAEDVRGDCFWIPLSEIEDALFGKEPTNE